MENPKIIFPTIKSDELIQNRFSKHLLDFKFRYDLMHINARGNFTEIQREYNVLHKEYLELKQDYSALLIRARVLEAENQFLIKLINENNIGLNK